MVNPLKKLLNQKLGLVLSSGGAKGIAQLTYLEFLDEHGVKPDYVAGASVGSLVGASYLCGTMYDLKEEVSNFTLRDKMQLIDIVFPKSGLIAGKRIEAFIKRYVDPDITFEDLPAAFAVVATDYETGQPVVFDSGNVLNAVLGSISIPGVFVPYQYNGKILIDGGVSNPIPIDVVKRMGADRIMAINLHPNAHRHVKPNKHKKRISHRRRINPVMGERLLTSRFNADSWTNFAGHMFGQKEAPRKSKKKPSAMPSIIDVFVQSTEIMEYQNTCLMLQYITPDVLVEPDVREINGLDFDKGKEVLAIAEKDLEKSKNEIIRKIVNWW